MSIFTVISAFGIIQSFLWGIALCTGKGSTKKPNRVLGALVVLIGFSITPLLFFDIKAPPVIAFLFKVAPDVRFLFGPFLYFYARALMTSHFHFHWKDLMHIIPYYAAGVSSGYLRFRAYEIWLVLDVFLTFACYAHVIFYSLPVILSVRKHVASLKESFSSLKSKTLIWLLSLAVFFMAIFGLLAIFEAMFLAGSRGYIIGIRYEIAAILVTLFAFSIGFLGMHQPDVFFGITEGQRTKYSGSTLTSSECSALYVKLSLIMETKKPFLDSELTVEKLSALSGIPDYHLSRVINEKSGMIFYDFINSFRIKEVQKLMSDPANNRYTILGLALDAGFNSKSAFYASFKKIMNVTPLEYRKYPERKPLMNHMIPKNP